MAAYNCLGHHDTPEWPCQRQPFQYNQTTCAPKGPTLVGPVPKMGYKPRRIGETGCRLQRDNGAETPLDECHRRPQLCTLALDLDCLSGGQYMKALSEAHVWRLCSWSSASSHPALTREKQQWNAILGNHHILAVSTSIEAFIVMQREKENKSICEVYHVQIQWRYVKCYVRTQLLICTA